MVKGFLLVITALLMGACASRGELGQSLPMLVTPYPYLLYTDASAYRREIRVNGQLLEHNTDSTPRGVDKVYLNHHLQAGDNRIEIRFYPHAPLPQADAYTRVILLRGDLGEGKQPLTSEQLEAALKATERRGLHQPGYRLLVNERVHHAAPGKGLVYAYRLHLAAKDRGETVRLSDCRLFSQGKGVDWQLNGQPVTEDAPAKLLQQGKNHYVVEMSVLNGHEEAKAISTSLRLRCDLRTLLQTGELASHYPIPRRQTERVLAQQTISGPGPYHGNFTLDICEACVFKGSGPINPAAVGGILSVFP